MTARFGRPERERAAAALRATSARAQARLDRFVEEGGIMVTTGQQAGLLTGPLYTIYKALTAARLAQELEARFGVLTLPVFWTASEDHDWEEVNHTFLDAEREGIHRLQLTTTPEIPLPMNAISINGDARNILDDASQTIGDHQDTSVLMKWIQESYSADSSVSGAFTELLGSMLAPFDICMTDAADGAVKAASREVIWKALTDGGEAEGVLRERTGRLEATGYHGQVGVLEGATNVFRTGRGGRERVYRDGEAFVTADGEERLTREALEREFATDPSRFSPNVLLRPVVESHVFPTVAYVGGPGEISYFAQASALFPLFGMKAPVAYPRESFLLVETPLRRLLEKLDIDAEELHRPRHELVESLAQGAIPDRVRDTLGEVDRSITDGYRVLIEEAIQIDPTLEGALARLRNEALTRIAESERKIAQHIKRKEGVRIGQLDRLLAHLRPDGQPQERVLNVIPYLARHGTSLLQQLFDSIEVPFDDPSAQG